MHPPLTPSTPEENRKVMRDADFQIAVATAIQKYFPTIPKYSYPGRYEIAAQTLKVVKERAEELADDV